MHLPSGEGPWPVVVLIHGGFWRFGADRSLSLMTHLAEDLAGRGIAAWNIEYRRVGGEGGGWPGTLEDAAAAIDTVAGMGEVDPARVVTVGHSAGGHLALWLAARHRIPAGNPGARPVLRPRGAVALAGVADLVEGARDGLGSGACVDLLGGLPAEQPGRYAVASPLALLPLGVPQLLVHGGLDDDVPLSQSTAYAASALAAGDEVELVERADAGHMDVIDVTDEFWTATCAWLDRVLDR